MISFWMTGTRSGDSSTPRSPRATITPSDARPPSLRFSTASGVSIFATIGVGSPPPDARAEPDVVRRLHERERDVVDAEGEADARDRVGPVGERRHAHAPRRQVDAHAIAQRAPLHHDAQRRSRRRPVHPQRDPPVVQADRRPRRADPRRGPRTRPRSSSAPPASLRPAHRLALADRRGPAAGRCGSSGPADPATPRSACRARAPLAHDGSRRACSSCVPCEKLSRATSIPASIRSPIALTSSVAGPNVQTILAWRRPMSGGILGTERGVSKCRA